MREAAYYERLERGAVHCLLCPRDCRVEPGKTGACRVRENRDGTLYAVKYGRCASAALDPIEKKPLYHFHPGTDVFSLGAFGCNLRCRHCQNWELSQEIGHDLEMSPREAVRAAQERSGPGRRCIGLAYTYSEPLVWIEHVLETAGLARAAGLKNVLVTNGYVNRGPLDELLPFIDAMNVDVKAFTDKFYRETCSGRLDPVLRTVETAYRAGCHVEVTYLLIPDLNDAPAEIARMADWLAELSADIPLHFSRYFPSWRMTRPPTPLETMEEARRLAGRRLHHVYLGNAWEKPRSETLCSSCGAVLVRREGFGAEVMELDGQKCARCGHDVYFRSEARSSDGARPAPDRHPIS